MSPRLETVLLLVVVTLFTSLAMAAHYWEYALVTTLVIYGAPCVAGFACGRITAIVWNATAYERRQ